MPISKIMYRANKRIYSSSNVESFRVIRETAKTVFFAQRMTECSQRKVSEDHQWFDAFDEAKGCVVSHCQREVEKLRVRLELAKGRWGNARGLKEQNVSVPR